MKLTNLLKNIICTANFDVKNIEVSDINCDTRIIPKENFLFMAIDGIDSDGHKYIGNAIENGASVIVGTKSLGEIHKEYGQINYIQVDFDTRRKVWAVLCANYFDYENNDAKILAVTGTDGKTTTTNFLYQLLLNSGKSVALFSTIGIFLNGEQIDKTLNHNTTPDSYILHKYIRKFKDENVDFIVLEASSFAQSQDRIYGLKFAAAGITNLTHEHLEQHKTYENYAKAKAGILEQADLKFINIDEIQHNQHIFENIKDRIDWNVDILQKYNINLEKFSQKFIGEYNNKNLSLALTILESQNVKEVFKNLQSKIDKLHTVEGRFESVENSLGLNIFVDYAHTPFGMESLLKSVSEKLGSGNKIHCVFGCEGRRDHGKRPKMGFIAKNYANYVYLAPTDSRTEDINEINSEIEAGWNENIVNPDFILKKFTDREEAIKCAIQNAEPGDYVLLLGKGDEKTIDNGQGKIDYNDFDAVKKILNSL